MNVEEIEKIIHDMDLACRPYALFVHPSRKEQFEQALKDAEMDAIVVVYPASCAELDKAIIMDRKKLDEWAIPRFPRYATEERGNTF